MAWVSPPTFTAGETVGVVTALNQLSGDLSVIGTPVAWTPTLTNITLGNGTQIAQAVTAGKVIVFEWHLTFGSTTTIAGGATVSLPATAARTHWTAEGAAWDSSLGGNTDHWPVWGVATSTTVITLRTLPSTAGNALVNVTAAVPISFTTGDIITVVGRYVTP